MEQRHNLVAVRRRIPADATSVEVHSVLLLHSIQCGLSVPDIHCFFGQLWCVQVIQGFVFVHHRVL